MLVLDLTLRVTVPSLTVMYLVPYFSASSCASAPIARYSFLIYPLTEPDCICTQPPFTLRNILAAEPLYNLPRTLESFVEGCLRILT